MQHITNELLADAKARGAKLDLVDPPKKKVALSIPVGDVRIKETGPGEGAPRKPVGEKVTVAELLQGCECKACKTNSKN